MIRFERVTLAYGGRAVLEEISFDLDKGQNLVILGENGVGKSTLAKAMIGMLTPEGSVTLEGQRPEAIPSLARAKLINYVPPKLESFETAVSLNAFVLMGRFPYKRRFEAFTREEELEATALCDRLGLEGCGNMLIGQLSSGQQQLALIAQAAMQKSRITIFDEPVANVDIGRIKRVFEIIRSDALFESKVVITHDLNFAHRLGFEVLFLKEARVAYRGPGGEFFSDASLAHHFNGAVSKTEKGIVVEYL